MSNKIKATALGILASLTGVVLWVVFGAFLQVIAGWAGAVMGVLFMIVYRKINPTDKTPYQIVVAVCLIVVEVIVSEMITLGIVAAMEGVDFGYALSNKDVQSAIIFELLIGYGLSFLVFGLYVYTSKKKANSAADQRKISTNINEIPTAKITTPIEANATIVDANATIIKTDTEIATPAIIVPETLATADIENKNKQE